MLDLAKHIYYGVERSQLPKEDFRSLNQTSLLTHATGDLWLSA